jgi:hypothetical protein
VPCPAATDTKNLEGSFDVRFVLDLGRKPGIGRDLLHVVHRAQSFITRQTWTQFRYAPTCERDPVSAR